MKLIRKLKGRKAQNGRRYTVKYGVYRCGYCNSEAELPVYIGGHKGHCGCQGIGAKNTAHCRDTMLRVCTGDTEHRVPTKAERGCLMCGKKFTSRGPQNRRCPACDRKIECSPAAYHMPPVHGVRDHSVVACCMAT